MHTAQANSQGGFGGEENKKTILLSVRTNSSTRARVAQSLKGRSSHSLKCVNAPPWIRYNPAGSAFPSLDLPLIPQSCNGDPVGAVICLADCALRARACLNAFVRRAVSFFGINSPYDPPDYLPMPCAKSRRFNKSGKLRYFPLEVLFVFGFWYLVLSLGF